MLHDELSIIMYGMGFKKLILRQTSLIRELCSEDVFQGTVKKLYIHTHTHTKDSRYLNTYNISFLTMASMARNSVLKKYKPKHSNTNQGQMYFTQSVKRPFAVFFLSLEPRRPRRGNI